MENPTKKTLRVLKTTVSNDRQDGSSVGDQPTHKFHQSSLFWIRLQKLYANSSHSHQSLAKAVGVDRKTIQRMLSGSTYRNVIALVYDIAQACGTTAEVLFDANRDLPVVSLTGIASIDRMLTTIHNCTTKAHIESYKEYISPKYLMFRGRDEEFTGAETKNPWRPREGITYERERELNLAASGENNTERHSTLRKAYIAGEQVVVIFDVDITSISNSSLKRTVRYIEHLELERALEDYERNGRLVPKIVRRHWAEIKER